MQGAKLMFHCHPCYCSHEWLSQAVMPRTRCTRDQARGCCREMRREGSASIILTIWHICQRIKATAEAIPAGHGTFVTQYRLRRRQELFLQNLSRNCQPQAQTEAQGCTACMCNHSACQKHRCRTESACFKNVETTLLMRWSFKFAVAPKEICSVSFNDRNAPGT
jgi:hypothetical protein